MTALRDGVCGKGLSHTALSQLGSHTCHDGVRACGRSHARIQVSSGEPQAMERQGVAASGRDGEEQRADVGRTSDNK